MSDEMPNTIWALHRNDPNYAGSYSPRKICNGKVGIQYTRTDWLRSQIEAAKKQEIPCDSLIEYQSRLDHNAALDQILNLLETGEKK